MKERFQFGFGFFLGFLLCHPELVTDGVVEFTQDRYKRKIDLANNAKVRDKDFKDILGPDGSDLPDPPEEPPLA